MHDTNLFELIDRVHAAPLEPEGWEEALDGLRATFEAAWAQVVVVDPGTGFTSFRVMRGDDPAFQERYERHEHALDPWAEPSLRQAEGTVGTSESILDPEALRRTDFYRRWLKPQGLEGGMGAMLRRHADGRVALACLVRAAGRAPYAEPELRVLRTLLPHLRRALQIEERLRDVRARRRLSEGLLERLGVAAALVDGGGRLIWVNRPCAALLRSPGPLEASRGHLVAAEGDELRRAIAEATHPKKARGGLLRVGDGPDGLGVTLWPVPPDEGERGPGHALVVVKPVGGGRRLSVEVVADLHGLTRTEATVAVALAEGADVRRIAGERGVSSETVRSQVKAVLAKTGCTRQAELVRLLLSGPAGWPDPRE